MKQIKKWVDMKTLENVYKTPVCLADAQSFGNLKLNILIIPVMLLIKEKYMQLMKYNFCKQPWSQKGVKIRVYDFHSS